MIVLLDYSSSITGLDNEGHLFWRDVLSAILQKTTPDQTLFTFILFAEDSATWTSHSISRRDVFYKYDDDTRGIKQDITEFSSRSSRLAAASFAGFMAALDVYTKHFVMVTDKLLLLAGDAFTTKPGKSMTEATELLHKLYNDLRPVQFVQIRFTSKEVPESASFLQASGDNDKLLANASMLNLTPRDIENFASVITEALKQPASDGKLRFIF